MMPWVRQSFQPAPLLVGREVIWSTRGVQQGDLMGPFLFTAGIQAAIEAQPPGGTMHKWYLDDGVFIGSVMEVEGVLAALQRALPHLTWSSICGRPRCGARAWCQRRSLTLPPHACIWKRGQRCCYFSFTPPSTPPRWIHTPLYTSAMEAYLAKLGAKFARACSAVACLAHTRSAQALMRSCLGPVKMESSGDLPEGRASEIGMWMG